MTEELVSFETAKLAKEKGFDEECMNAFEYYLSMEKTSGPLPITYGTIGYREMGPGAYKLFRERPELYEKITGPQKNSGLPPYLYARPSQDLLERWLREVHALMPGQVPIVKDKKIIGFVAAVIPLNNANVDQKLIPTEYKTFELAREAALQHALKLLPDNETRLSKEV